MTDDASLSRPIDVTDDDLVLGIEARPVEEIEILIEGAGAPRGPSEFDQVLRALQPILLDRSPAQLDEEKFRDVTFAARETGVEQDRVDAIVAAFKLARDLAPETLRTRSFTAWRAADR